MGFILDGLETEAYDRTYSDRELLRRILSYFAPYRRQMIAGRRCHLAELAGRHRRADPDLTGHRPAGSEQPTHAGLILLLSGGLLLLGVLAWVFNFIQQWFSARVVGDVVLKLREDVFAATIRHDLSFFDEHPSGKIVSRVTSDTQDFSDVVTLITNLISQVLLVVVLSVWLFSINVRLTLLLLAMAPLAVVIALELPAHRPHGHAARAARDGQDQRADPGVGQRHRGGQELPPGARHLRHLRGQQPAGLRRGAAPRPDVQHASSRS